MKNKTKSLKRMLALILAGLLVIGTVTVTYAADEELPPNVVVYEDDYYNDFSTFWPGTANWQSVWLAPSTLLTNSDFTFDRHSSAGDWTHRWNTSEYSFCIDTGYIDNYLKSAVKMCFPAVNRGTVTVTTKYKFTTSYKSYAGSLVNGTPEQVYTDPETYVAVPVINDYGYIGGVSYNGSYPELVTTVDLDNGTYVTKKGNDVLQEGEIEPNTVIDGVIFGGLEGQSHNHIRYIKVEIKTEYNVTFNDENGEALLETKTENARVTPTSYSAGGKAAVWKDQHGNYVQDFSNVDILEDKVYTAVFWADKDIDATVDADKITVDAKYVPGAEKCVLTEYDLEGNILWSEILTDKIVEEDGENGLVTTFTTDELERTVDTANKKYKILIISDSDIPCIQPYTVVAGDSAECINNSSFVDTDGTAEELDVSVDAVTKIITVTGKYKADETAFIKFMLDDNIKLYDSFVCDEDGGFTFTYDYSGEYEALSEDDLYNVEFYGLLSTLKKEPEDFVIKPVIKSVYDGIMLDINGLADGAALVEYAETNADELKILGVDVNGDYKNLKADNKLIVMTDMLGKLQAEESGMKAKFDAEANEIYTLQLQIEAIGKLDGGVVSSVGGVFRDYHKVLLSDTLWNKYTKNEKKWEKIHGEYIDIDIDLDIDDYHIIDNKEDIRAKVAEIADNLSTAINRATSTGGGGGSGGDGDDGGSKADKKEPTDLDYTVPKEPVEIYEPIQPKAFNDVANDFWGYEAITTLATRGIIDGVGGGNFAPETTVTREAFVKMLVEALGLKANGVGKAFSDVDANAWYAEYVNIASSIGLVEGYDGKFGIGEGLTREQMATMLYRAANLANIKLEAKNEVKDFSDSEEIGEYAVEAVNALYQAGIVNGMADGSYAPKTVCTRAMAAKVIYEILAIK